MTQEHEERPKPNLRPIEGGRAIAARDMQAAFASETADVTALCEEMAGFFIVAWNDEGEMTTAHSIGSRSPYSPELAADLISKKVTVVFNSVGVP